MKLQLDNTVNIACQMSVILPEAPPRWSQLAQLPSKLKTLTAPAPG